MNATIGRSFICSAIGVARAKVAIALPIAPAIPISKTASRLDDIAVSEGFFDDSMGLV